MRCWRCASTAPSCRRITAIRRASSCRRCPVCTTPSGSVPSTFVVGEMTMLMARFRKFYGSHPLHLLTMAAGFALAGYVMVTFGPATLWNSDAWWQSIAIWLAVAIVVHDLALFPLYALADRL